MKTLKKLFYFSMFISMGAIMLLSLCLAISPSAGVVMFQILCLLPNFIILVFGQIFLMYHRRIGIESNKMVKFNKGLLIAFFVIIGLLVGCLITNFVISQSVKTYFGFMFIFFFIVISIYNLITWFYMGMIVEPTVFKIGPTKK